MYRKLLKGRAVAFALGLILSVALLEAGLRVAGVSYERMQEYRNRARLAEGGDYRIMCIGESTTADWKGESYPRQLQRILDSIAGNGRFVVINKGMNRVDTSVLMANLEENLDRYGPDMVIAMMGANDAEGSALYESALPRTVNPCGWSRACLLARLLWRDILRKMRPYAGEGITERQREIFYRETGELAKLERTVKDAIERRPDDYNTYMRLALTYNLQSRYDEAESLCRRLIRAAPGQPGAYMLLAEILSAQSRYEEAYGLFREGLSLSPEDIGAWVDLAGACRKTGRCGEAAEIYGKVFLATVTGRSPVNITAEESELYFRRMSEVPAGVKSYQLSVLFDLAFCYQKLGRYDGAARVYTAMERKDPKRAYEGLSLLYAETGDEARARHYGDKAREARLAVYPEVTRENFLFLADEARSRGIELVCMQYPMRSVAPLRAVFAGRDDVAVVDNEMLFGVAVARNGYDTYFSDRYYADFGHCTPAGNALLARSAAEAVLQAAGYPDRSP